MKQTTLTTIKFSSLAFCVAMSCQVSAQEYIIKYKSGATSAMAGFASEAGAKGNKAQVFSEMGAATILRNALISDAKHVPEFNFSVAKLSKQQIAELNNSGAVEYIEVDSKR